MRTYEDKLEELERLKVEKNEKLQIMIDKLNSILDSDEYPDDFKVKCWKTVADTCEIIGSTEEFEKAMGMKIH